MSEVKEQKKETTSIKINPKVWKDAKIKAIEESITVSELVETAIENYIKEREKK